MASTSLKKYLKIINFGNFGIFESMNKFVKIKI
jgi:hypothetical protein